MGHHHGIFLKPSSTAPVHFIAVMPEIDHLAGGAVDAQALR